MLRACWVLRRGTAEAWAESRGGRAPFGPSRAQTVGGRMYVRGMAVVEDVAVVDGLAALAGIPAGPRLAAALARIDVTHVPNNELLALLAAQSRQANHEAARLLGVIAEIGRAAPTFDDDAVDRLDHPVPYAADEVRAALAWSGARPTGSATSPSSSCTTFPRCTRHTSPATSTDPRCASSPITSAGSPRPRSAPSARSCFRWPAGSPPASSSPGCVAWWRPSIPGTTSAATTRRCATARCAPGWMRTAPPCSAPAACPPPRRRPPSSGSTSWPTPPAAPDIPPPSTRSAWTSWPGCSTAPFTTLTATRSSPICSPTVLATTTHHRPTPATTTCHRAAPATTRPPAAGGAGAAPPHRRHWARDHRRCGDQGRRRAGTRPPRRLAMVSDPSRVTASSQTTPGPRLATQATTNASRIDGAGGTVHPARPRRATRRDPRPRPGPASHARAVVARANTAPSRRTPSPTTPSAAVRRCHPAASRGAHHHRATRRDRRAARTWALLATLTNSGDAGPAVGAGRAYWPTSPASTANATARPRRPPTTVTPSAAPPHPDPRPHVRRHRLPPPPRPLRPGPHRRPPVRRADRRRRPGTAVPPRPHPQRASRLDPPTTEPRHVPLDQPTRRAIPGPPRARPATAARPLSRTRQRSA